MSNQNQGNRNDNIKAITKIKRERKGEPSMNEQAEQQFEQVTQNLMKACEEIKNVCCDSMSAMATSSAALAKGSEEFSHTFGNLMQQTIARTMNASRTIMGAKSLKELSDLQSEFVRDCFEQWMSGTGRLSEISARVTKDTIEPVAKHATVTMSKVAQQAQANSKAAA